MFITQLSESLFFTLQSAWSGYLLAISLLVILYMKYKNGIIFQVSLIIAAFTLTSSTGAVIVNYIRLFYPDEFSYYLISYLLLMVILLAVSVRYLYRNIVHPLNIIVETSKKVADGDLTTSINKTNLGVEIDSVSLALKIIISSYKEAIEKISSFCLILSFSSQEITSSTQQVMTSSEEISIVSQEISKGSRDQIMLIEKSRELSNELASIFKSKIAEVEKTTKKIEAIATQVNILALNASIEAARSGEYGKGFAIVAENIRLLADDSKKSLLEIGQVILDLHDSLTNSIKEIVTSIEEVTVVTEKFSIESNETMTATEEQTSMMEEISVSAQELAKIALDLEQIVKFYQIEDLKEKNSNDEKGEFN